MNKTIGLINDKIRLIKRNIELLNILIAKLSDKEDYDLERLEEMLFYNIWTTSQYCDLTGLGESTITNKTRPKYNKDTGEIETELDFCYPHKSFTKLGPKFIVRNEKSERLLK